MPNDNSRRRPRAASRPLPAARVNIVLSAGKEMMSPVKVPLGPRKSPVVYGFQEAAARLSFEAELASTALDDLPSNACPADEAVAFLTLHPRFIAKSFYPAEFFDAAGLRPLGSRRRRVTPLRGDPGDTAQYYVAGTRAQFRELPNRLRDWGNSGATLEVEFAGSDDKLLERAMADPQTLGRGPSQLVRFENIQAVEPAERLGALGEGEVITLEAVLHADEEDPRHDLILDTFARFVTQLDGNADLERRINVDGLTFLPVVLPRTRSREFGGFAFLRYARASAPLSRLHPVMDLRGRPASESSAKVSSLPSPTVRGDIRVAVIDGGVDDAGPLAGFVTTRELPGIGPADADSVVHGTGVTSAVLFGPLLPGEPVKAPFASVEHVRVIDNKTHEDDPFELFTVLKRIQEAMTGGAPYDFVNLSIGPVNPVEDDQPHAWTTMLDSILADGRTFATIAVGNSGEADRASGNARLLPPSDAVNALAVGAANVRASPWTRASYSCVGPGRRPGLVKPDVLSFGGSPGHPFWVLDGVQPLAMRATAGTSFAAPALLRTAIGLRATYGSGLTAVGLKALLVHAAETPAPHLLKSTSEDEARAVLEECGWGRVPLDPEELVLGPTSSVRIVYQGRLRAGSTTRITVPLPEQLQGMVTVTATFCFATHVDPQDPVSYTRSALSPVFRPDSRKVDEGADALEIEGDANLETDAPTRRERHANSRSFFRASRLKLREGEQRTLGFKWEPVLHGTERLRSNSLHDPVFDVHYIARHRGDDARPTAAIPYALVLTVDAPKVVDLYDRVLTRYRTLLQPLRPTSTIAVPIGVR